MPEKFTYEKHQERMRRILAQVEPVERIDVLSSILERVRGTRPAETRPLETPPPRPPRLAKLRSPKL